MKPWSEKEQAILERHYPTEGALVAKRLPGRTVGSIRVRAAMHGLKMSAEGKRAAHARGGLMRRQRGFEGLPAAGVSSPAPLDSLPTVLYPVDPDTSRSVASACQYLAHFSEAVKAVGPEATRFFESLCQRLRAHADQTERMARETASVIS